MPTPIDISKKLNELKQDLEQAVDSFISKGQEIIFGWSLYKFLKNPVYIVNLRFKTHIRCQKINEFLVS